MVSDSPETAQLHAVLLGGVDATTVQFARSAFDRTTDIARQAVESNPHRDDKKVTELCVTLNGPLINDPKMHGAVVGIREATKAGLDVNQLSMDNSQWKSIQQIWTRYFALGPVDRRQAYEGARASQVHFYPEG